MAEHDLVIRNGTVIDGTGTPRRQGDVAVSDGRVTAVGEVDGTGRQELDADGLVVAPGWVDIHTHYDGQATWDPTISPSPWHGVTTIVMGNCGVGFAPVRPDRHEWLVALMEGVEDIPGTALHEGITWDWETFPEYLDALGARRARPSTSGPRCPTARSAATSWATVAPSTPSSRPPTRSTAWAAWPPRASRPGPSASPPRARWPTSRSTAA